MYQGQLLLPKNNKFRGAQSPLHFLTANSHKNYFVERSYLTRGHALDDVRRNFWFELLLSGIAVIYVHVVVAVIQYTSDIIIITTTFIFYQWAVGGWEKKKFRKNSLTSLTDQHSRKNS